MSSSAIEFRPITNRGVDQRCVLHASQGQVFYLGILSFSELQSRNFGEIGCLVGSGLLCCMSTLFRSVVLTKHLIRYINLCLIPHNTKPGPPLAFVRLFC